ncbi:mismatch-specific DNA-glycosylase [Microbacterium sp. NPDC077391]|uniref:mismatch-specific DNA-glycosylase n=1 Tax=unclassified Microbacterium TaxID=2609290 RepID=UPI0028AE38D8|nr:mismatch-specific DNA-glycosylase [Microbacterium sp.]
MSASGSAADALPADWSPWRAPSPLEGRRPSPVDLAHATAAGLRRDDVLPYPTDAESAGRVRLLMVGINPSPWTIAVNAPFARPGNRFWSSLAVAGLTDEVVDASRGLSPADERMLAARGIGMTNLVARPTARADELEAHELRLGGRRLLERVGVLRPRSVAVVGVTAFRTAFSVPRARMGAQEVGALSGWPKDIPLWVVPNPSGLNAHETVESLAEWWRKVWAASAPSSAP